MYDQNEGLAQAMAESGTRAAQDARDLLAETTVLMLAALCQYHGIDRRGDITAQTIAQKQVGELRRATNRDIATGQRR